MLRSINSVKDTNTVNLIKEASQQSNAVNGAFFMSGWKYSYIYKLTKICKERDF